MQLSTGVDLIDISRIREALERHGEKFSARIFTQAELQECRGRLESLAARFAAKEAASKALGCGIGEVSWLDIEILGDEQHAPHLYLRNTALRIAEEKGLRVWSVSLSHTAAQAIAFVVAAGA